MAQGRKYLSPTLAERLGENFSLGHKSEALHGRLSRRELEVLRLLGSGYTIKQIADLMKISVKTASTHRTRLLEKMGLKTNAQLIRYAIRSGLERKREEADSLFHTVQSA